MHKQLSELLCGACETQDIQGHKMSKYLKDRWSEEHTLTTMVRGVPQIRHPWVTP